MYYNKEDRNIFLMIITVLIVSIIALIAIFNNLWQLVKTPLRDFSSQISQISKSTNIDYNFPIPKKKN